MQYSQPGLRGVDIHGRAHCVELTDDATYLSLSSLSLSSVKLAALHSHSNLRDLSLAANSLHSIDLSPLASCHSLVVLSLNSNRITNIDLTPLSSCPNLQRLWLHDNRLETIDLTPLKSCATLRSLYLEDNSIHNSTIDLSPLSHTTNLRSLRLSGNRLAANLDLTPLFQCPALSVFNIDTSVVMVADGHSSLARVSPALRRIVLDINFSGKPLENNYHHQPIRKKLSPPTSPPGSLPTTSVTRRKSISPSSSPVVKVLLVGFRRLARYAAEDTFSRCGKVIIRATSHDVATRDASLLLDSHLVLLHTPTETTLRQVTVVVGTIPTVVVGTERYRSMADNRMLQLLDNFNFYPYPLTPDDTSVIYQMAVAFENPSSSSASSVTPPHSSPVSDDGQPPICTTSLRKSYSESSISTAIPDAGIEFEDIDDIIVHPDPASPATMPRCRSAERLRPSNAICNSRNGPATTWSEVTRRLTNRAARKTGRGWRAYISGELSVHGQNKLRAERSSVQAAFSDLGGYATSDSCAPIARSCGLPKCAATLLFRAALGSTFDLESTTPEAGVPYPLVERKNRRISVHSFLRYWDSRLKSFDGEERLSNILEDSHLTRSGGMERCTGHSQYGAPKVVRTTNPSKSHSTLSEIDVFGYVNKFARSESKRSDSCLEFHRAACPVVLPNDLSCPCDAGIEALITSFMEGRRSRFGAFALVKLSEAIAIGSALVMYGLRGVSKNRVGGRARPVCPKEVRDGKLNAALIAAEVGIFEGVASGLSMDQIRSVKASFATEVSPASLARTGGTAVDIKLTREQVHAFCASRKSLLPGAVELLMAIHCRDTHGMTLAEFSILLSVLNNIASNGAVDYLFTVIDTDHDERWSIADLRHFHMEKERIWLKDGMAVSDLRDLWVNLVDMTEAKIEGRAGISRREVMRLGAKERKMVMQSVLFVDDDHSLLNIRRTMELNQNSTNPLVMM